MIIKKEKTTLEILNEKADKAIGIAYNKYDGGSVLGTFEGRPRTYKIYGIELFLVTREDGELLFYELEKKETHCTLTGGEFIRTSEAKPINHFIELNQKYKRKLSSKVKKYIKEKKEV